MSEAAEIFLPRDAAAKIANSAALEGDLSIDLVEAEGVFVVNKVGIGSGVILPVVIPPEYKVLKWTNASFQGHWVRRASGDINIKHLLMLRRPAFALAYDEFKEHVPELRNPGGNTEVLITHDPDVPDALCALGVREFAGWLVRRDGVTPLSLDIEPDTLGIDQLEKQWPVKALADLSVMVVGCGSIGGYTAEALARYGVGRIELVDPDRLRWHNTLRHIVGPEGVGAYKVTALARALRERWPTQQFTPHKFDVVSQAHDLRPLLRDVDLVICTADGIAARRVISHLARRARKTAVLACVLDDGAFGEVLRLRPTPKFGCLLCLRRAQEKKGAMDIEAAQERDYGTGHVHLPMTAVPPDLQLVGVLAAKVGVATLLESGLGDDTQRIPNEYAVMGLRPASGGELLAPFDLDYVGEIRWQSIPPPAVDCITCSP